MVQLKILRPKTAIIRAKKLTVLAYRLPGPVRAVVVSTSMLRSVSRPLAPCMARVICYNTTPQERSVRTLASQNSPALGDMFSVKGWLCPLHKV